jgi:hypothetical protein
MNRTEYIRSRFEKVLLENINEKADEILTKLNLDKEVPFDPPGGPTDYVQESEVCEQCGSEMTEGECLECGDMYEGDIQELGGMDTEHPRFGKMNLKKMSKDELEDLLNTDYDDESDEDDEWEEIDLDTESDWEKLEEQEEELDEKLYGKQHKLDKNKNGKLDADDFKRLRNMKEEDEPLYEVEFEKEIEEGSKPDFLDLDKDGDKKEPMKSAAKDAKKKEVREKWEGDVEVKQTGEYSDMTIEELNAAIKKQKAKNDKTKEAGKKVSHADKTKMSQLYFAKRAKQGWKGKGKAKVTESLIFTENELISLIEKMVNEEKNSFKMKEPKGYVEYEKAHNKDKKENEDYLKSVAKKMTDYLKGASDNGSKYEMKETQKFPTENGGMKKGNRKKYTPSDAVDEYIDAFSYPGQTNLVYDEIKPNDEWIEANLKGSSKTGNAQVDKDGNALGNVVPSEVGEKFFKNFQDNLYGQEQQDASYKRQPQPVDQAGEQTERGSLKSKRGKKTSQSVLNKLEETTNEKKLTQLNEEFDRIQGLMGYNRKTQ